MTLEEEHDAQNETFALVDENDNVTFIGDSHAVRTSEEGLRWVRVNPDDVVRIGYQYNFKTRKFVRVRHPMDIERKQVLDRLNEIYRTKVGYLLSSFDDYEVMTFPFQVMSLFERQLDIPNGICQMFLKGLALGRRETTAQSAEAIENATRQLLMVIGYITGCRHHYEKHAQLVQDHAQIDELNEQIDEWERSPLIPNISQGGVA